MIKCKQVFLWTSYLKGLRFHGNKATILYLILKYYSFMCSLKNFIFFKLVQYFKSYDHLNVWCWKRWIQISSTEKHLNPIHPGGGGGGGFPPPRQ